MQEQQQEQEIEIHFTPNFGFACQPQSVGTDQFCTTQSINVTYGRLKVT